VAALLQDANQVTTDEATGAGDDHEIILGHWAGPFQRKRALVDDRASRHSAAERPTTYYPYRNLDMTTKGVAQRLEQQN
jgi:hypothetical protein